MVYLYTNKLTNESIIFGSLVILCSDLNLKKDKFYTHFGRNANTKYENDSFRIVKTEIRRNPHTKK